MGGSWMLLPSPIDHYPFCGACNLVAIWTTPSHRSINIILNDTSQPSCDRPGASGLMLNTITLQRCIWPTYHLSTQRTPPFGQVYVIFGPLYVTFWPYCHTHTSATITILWLHFGWKAFRQINTKHRKRRIHIIIDELSSILYDVNDCKYTFYG